MSKKLIKSATSENGRGRMPRPSLTPPPDLFPSRREIPVSQKIRTNEDLLPPHRFMESDFVSEKLPVESDTSEEFMEEYLPEMGRGRMPKPTFDFISRERIPVSQKIRTEEDFADDLMTSQARDTMLRDLVKLATQFDNSGLYKEAERIDGMLKKLSGLYKSKSEGSRMDDNFNDLDKWFNRDRFAQVGEQDIASDYLTKRYNLQVVDSPDEYIQYMEVQPWQEEKVRKAIKENPPSKTFRPEYLGEASELMNTNFKIDSNEPLESDDIVKLLCADKDDSVQYKMSPELFKKIVSGRSLTKGDLTEADMVILD